jgi:DNA-binding Lrp family transcriptional regulator
MSVGVELVIGIKVGDVQPVKSAPCTAEPEDERKIKLGRVLEDKEIVVPDSLWANDRLSHGAKLLWCLLWLLRIEFPELTFAEIREVLGISQTSVIKHLRALADLGLIQWEKPGLRRIAYTVIRPGGQSSIVMPTDILFNPSLRTQAKWLWGIIRRLQAPFTYHLLRALTGYCRESINIYLAQLRQGGWLGEKQTRVNRYIHHDNAALNPCAEQRKTDLEAVDQCLREADGRDQYSKGQALLALYLKLGLRDGTVVENATMPGHFNPMTGGQFTYDIFIPEYNVVIEFHGLQHAGPTERFPDVEQFKSLRARDLMKAGLTWIDNRVLITIWPNELSFERLRERLEPWVPLKRDFRGQWHLHDRLEQIAKWYRQKAQPNG